ncbi:MFS transporter [Klebsiella pneumoniae]|uniref:MFS transporter n=3 Tax=Klebsiella/Raoultella group TaxID=2890311 RepID=UPI003A5CE017
MTGKEIMITTLRRSTIALLASSLLLTIGRGATLPFMTIYLTRRFQLEVDVIGYALSLALVVGVLFSMGFGILADRFDKKRYMVWSVLVFILGFSAIPLVNNALLVVIFFALINCAYSVFSTVLKAWFADRLTAEKKARIFSLNYTILNIGWTVGPPIGTLLVMHSINLPFWLAAACAAFPLVFIQLFLQRDGAAAAQPGAAVVYLLRAAGLLRRRRLRLLSLAVCAGGRQQRIRRESGGRGAAGQRRGGGCSAVRGWPAAEREKYPPADDLRHRLLCDRPCGLYVLWRQPVGVGDLGGDLHPRGSDLCPRGVYAD